MSDFEFFNPSEGGESYDPAAFERFKEKVKKNAAFIAAAQKSEQKQKQKEDKLAKILMQFIQKNQKSGILMLAALLLKENIPASFILSIIILGNDEMQQEIRRELQLNEEKKSDLEISQEGIVNETPGEFAVATRFSDSALPLKLKAEIDAWAQGIFESASAVPFRILETALNPGGTVKQVVMDCSANVLDDYLATNKFPSVTYDACFGFSQILMQSVMKRLQKQIENQKELT